MKEKNQIGSIYTLGLNGTKSIPIKKETTIISGTGTIISNISVLLKRANKKAIGNSLALALVDVAKLGGDTYMTKRYWNTYHCQAKLTSADGRYHSKWCKNRWCPTCCGIRKAILINKYYPIISKWEEPHLVTITLKSVKAKHLKARINQMISAFRRIKDRCNKRHLRGTGMKIKGIKSLECNFNASKRTYNPHYHLIVPNRVIGLYIMQEWKKELNKNEFNVGSKGQHIRAVEKTEKDLVEVIKYGAKILCDPDPEQKRKRSRGDMTGLQIYAGALHTIYKAFDKHHLFTKFGFQLPREEKKVSSVREIYDFANWQYQPELMDWVNKQTGELLTEYEIDGYLEYILSTKIDKELI